MIIVDTCMQKLKTEKLSGIQEILTLHGMAIPPSSGATLQSAVGQILHEVNSDVITLQEASAKSSCSRCLNSEIFSS